MKLPTFTPNYQQMHARELISGLIPFLTKATTPIEAIHLMEEARVSHLPVVDEDQYLGILSETALYELTDPETPLSGQRAALQHVSVAAHQHVYEVIRIMAEEKLDILPVLDVNQHYLGSVHVADLLASFSALVVAAPPGGIIVLELNHRDFVLSEIARIVESNDARILSMYVEGHTDSTRMDVTIKLNKTDIAAVLQTFNRFNYTVKATFSAGEYTDDLRERYDSLMRYLNI